MDQTAWGWVKLAEEAINEAGGLANDLRGFVDIPPLQLYATFRIRVTVFVAGNITGHLRFGYTDADATVAVEGLDFALLGALDASSLRSITWGGPAPGPLGTSPGIMPPRIAVFLDAAAPTDLTYELSGSAVQATG